MSHNAVMRLSSIWVRLALPKDWGRYTAGMPESQALSETQRAWMHGRHWPGRSGRERSAPLRHQVVKATLTKKMAAASGDAAATFTALTLVIDFVVRVRAPAIRRGAVATRQLLE